MKYYPFLKLKLNEILAIKDLSPEISEIITPVFDIPRPQKLTALTVAQAIESGKENLARHWIPDKEFFLDAYDIPDHIRIHGSHVYQYVLEKFKSFKYIPIVGLNRHQDHFKAVIHFLNELHFKKVGIRLTWDDFVDFSLVKQEISSVIEKLDGLNITFIFDSRLIVNEDTKQKIINDIIKFAPSLIKEFSVEELIISGSSIDANISTHLSTKSETSISRFEWDIYLVTSNTLGSKLVRYGDYCIISPNYSDANIESELIQSVSTPKVFYTEESIIHMFRGGAFKTHPRGRDQYFDIAKKLVNKSFFRGPNYSFGDKFIKEKSKQIGSASSQGNWYRMLNNCHMSFVCKDLL